MDKILERFRAIKWNHAPRDEAARAELDRRIADAGCRGGLVTYSDLVRGITELGLIASSKTDKAMFLWSDHVDKAHKWYSRYYNLWGRT